MSTAPKCITPGCQRPAVTKIKGRYKASPNHDYCRQCWRSAMDRNRAKLAQSRKAS